jgi:prevent-host-death family protein
MRAKPSPRHAPRKRTKARRRGKNVRAWKLEDAKARFSEVVRLARERGPQRVTVHGKDAVVIVSAAEYARLAPVARQPSLHALLSSSPLRTLDFEHESVRAPVRDVIL